MNTQTLPQSFRETQSSKTQGPKTFRDNHGFEAVGTILNQMFVNLALRNDMLADDGDTTP